MSQAICEHEAARIGLLLAGQRTIEFGTMEDALKSCGHSLINLVRLSHDIPRPGSQSSMLM